MQVVVDCDFKVRGLLRPAFLRSAGDLVFGDADDTSKSKGATAEHDASENSSSGAYRGFQTFVGPELLGYLEHGMLTLSVAMRSHAHEGQLLGMAVGPRRRLSDGSPTTPPFLSIPMQPARVKRARTTHPIDTSNALTGTTSNKPGGSAAAAATTLSTITANQVTPTHLYCKTPQPALAPNATHPKPNTSMNNFHPNPLQRRRLHVPTPRPGSLGLPPLEDIYLQRDWDHEVVVAGNPKTAWGQQQQQHHQHLPYNAYAPHTNQSHYITVPQTAPTTDTIPTPDTNPSSPTTPKPNTSDGKNRQTDPTPNTTPAATSPAAATVSVVVSSIYPSRIRTLARRQLAPRLVATTTHSL